MQVSQVLNALIVSARRECRGRYQHCCQKKGKQGTSEPGGVILPELLASAFG
jgi:hypothetical protein